ncbi:MULTISPECIES: diguanylate cyclase [Undibacterium]|uniref:diguanylate cyclase n=1 Tax=Undibacterium parvum TaxID=401471 RepID=A0A3Q9BUD3_9BURK|nr:MULTISPECIES: diguanylate cyclase [Undibacterium]AZP13670.1 diguanylate cyclase [Undibacterium parvum]
MDAKEDSLQDALAALNLLFAEKLPSKLAEIEAALAQFMEHPQDVDALTLLHRLLHTMSGSAGTFGFDDLGRRSRQLEVRIKALLTGAVWIDLERAQFNADVRDYLAGALLPTKDAALALAPVMLANKTQDDASSRLIYILDQDAAMCTSIGVQLQHFGYSFEIIPDLKALAGKLAAIDPELILMNLGAGDDAYAGASEIERIRASGISSAQVLFFADTNSFQNRLRAVRSGGSAYVTKPVDMSLLIERVDGLMKNAYNKGYRILIIDDDVATSKYHASILESAHMSVQVLNNPLQLFEVMSEFRPELILLDVYMPKCDGVELAKMVRQDDTFLDIPIVFLSTERDFAKQLDAVKAGADDFLSKPIPAEFLVSAISTRAERYRSLRTLILRDGLTGLYNHTAIKEELISEVAISNRNQAALAVAMLDLDNFKHVNDTYGHPIGDQVLRTLSRLLRQRLRRSDVLGRYGGEEFLVIFPATSALSAQIVLDEVRLAFMALQQHSEQGEFSVTFSAGVSDLSLAQDVDALIACADAALYEAKKTGKNRVVLGLAKPS